MVSKRVRLNEPQLICSKHQTVLTEIGFQKNDF
jgi:hypothetical protein